VITRRRLVQAGSAAALLQGVSPRLFAQASAGNRCRYDPAPLRAERHRPSTPWPGVPRLTRFEGLEDIPGMEALMDANDEPVMLRTRGDTPLIICTAHSGTSGSTPRGAKTLGPRRSHSQDDTNTLPIALGAIRALSSLGARPNSLLNLVSRRYIDQNRTWAGQGGWQTTVADGCDGQPCTVSVLPGFLADPPADLSPDLLDRLTTLNRTYYASFHDELCSMTSRLNPDAWLFDIHGKNFNDDPDLTGTNLLMFTGYGHYADRSKAYDDTRTSLHRAILDEGLRLHPVTADPGREVNRDGALTVTNLISGGRFGASHFDAGVEAAPRRDPVTPRAGTRRVHGVQFEFRQEVRFGASDEDLEAVGMNLGHAIHRFAVRNGLIVPAARGASHALPVEQALLLR